MRHRLRDPVTGRFIKKASSKGRKIQKSRRASAKRVPKRMRATEAGGNVVDESISIENVYDGFIKTRLPDLPVHERINLVNRMVMFGSDITNIDDIYEFVDIFNWDQFRWKEEKENDFSSLSPTHICKTCFGSCKRKWHWSKISNTTFSGFR